MGTYCSANDVSGVDAGDYAGPKVSFSNITSASTIYDTGAVVITSLANGATTFFSLNGPPSGIQASGGLLITVPLTATGTNLGAINLGGTISGAISVTGGAPSYTFAVIGSVPAGITVNGGAISGVAAQTGTFCVSFRVTDSADATATASVSYSVVHPSAPPLVVSGVNLGAIALGGSVSGSVTATGGTPPYAFSVTGAVPSGITVTGATISGAATQAGTFSVNFTVTDSAGVSGAASITYAIPNPPAPPLVVRGVNLGTVALGGSVSGSVTATGGAPPYTFTPAGTPPTGINVNGATVGGTAGQTGSYSVGVTVTDSAGASGTASVSYSVFGVAATSLPSGITYSPLFGLCPDQRWNVSLHVFDFRSSPRPHSYQGRRHSGNSDRNHHRQRLGHCNRRIRHLCFRNSDPDLPGACSFVGSGADTSGRPDLNLLLSSRVRHRRRAAVYLRPRIRRSPEPPDSPSLWQDLRCSVSGWNRLIRRQSD
jgi:hypothetical protein